MDGFMINIIINLSKGHINIYFTCREKEDGIAVLKEE
jgi:hypothetical protein